MLSFSPDTLDTSKAATNERLPAITGGDYIPSAEGELRKIWSLSQSLKSVEDTDFGILLGSSDSSLLSIYKGLHRVIPRFRNGTCTLPLADIAKPKFNYARFVDLFGECPPHGDLITLLSWVTTAELANKLEQTYRPCHVTVSHVPSIYDKISDLISQVTFVEQHARANMRVFTVPKSDQVTSRLILDCRHVNEAIKKVVLVPRMPIPSIHEIIDAAMTYEFMSTVDVLSRRCKCGE